MKIIALTDLHGQKKPLQNLDKYLENNKFDLLLFCGDLLDRWDSTLEYMIDFEHILAKHKLNWLCVHGNNEPSTIVNYLKVTERNLHYEPKKINQYTFMGIGGWGYELPPYPLNFDPRTILLTHIPPHIKDQNPPELKNAPLLHLSGHMHHWQKVRKAGKTTIVNIPSAGYKNKAITIELPSLKTTFITLE